MLRGKPHKHFDVISVNDPAIDNDSFDGAVALTKYARERDTSALLLKPGGQPTTFKCRPMTHHSRLFVESLDGEARRHVAAFQVCVVNVENLELEQPWRPQTRASAFGTGLTILTDAAVEQLSDAGLGKVVEEVGSVCLQRATMLPDQKKVYQLPLGCEVKQMQPDSHVTSQAVVPASEEH
jgi:hypothetical protein